VKEHNMKKFMTRHRFLEDSMLAAAMKARGPATEPKRCGSRPTEVNRVGRKHHLRPVIM
jgi:hypothetical protein